jgi:hypothetical protein
VIVLNGGFWKVVVEAALGGMSIRGTTLLLLVITYGMKDVEDEVMHAK